MKFTETDEFRAELKAKGRVNVHGVGVFKVTAHKARIGRNPRTGESIDIPAQNRVSFKAAPAIKEAVN